MARGPDTAVPMLAGYSKHLRPQGEAGCVCTYFLKSRNELHALLPKGLDREVHACTAFQTN